MKTRFSEVWVGSCSDCSDEWLKVAKITALGHAEGPKALHMLHNSVWCPVVSRWWK
jgi:hypothetical protein